MFYILNSKHLPVKATNTEWAAWISNKNKLVRSNHVGDVHVSTVFLGLDHNYTGVGEPILFETMIFGGEHDEYQTRYTSWDDAVAGHKVALELVK